MIKRTYQLIALLNKRISLRLLICFLPGLLAIKLAVMLNAASAFRIIAFSLFALGLLCFVSWNKLKTYYLSLKEHVINKKQESPDNLKALCSNLSLSQCLDDMLFLTQDEKYVIQAIKRADILNGHGDYEQAILKAHQLLCQQYASHQNAKISDS